MIGETILHYNIVEKLGEGGMGTVYKAQDTKLDRFVALKFLSSSISVSDDDKARFIQEAKAASAMNHPNVCTIYDIQENEGQLFIVMEFVDGKTLKNKKGSLSEKQILEMGVQVAEGLSA
ncbi:MAG: serine/threonine-protein kinase, partial [Ignavibacteriaceae bacterium]